MHESANMQMTWTGSSYDYISVSHQNGFWAEYSGRNLAEYSAESNVFPLILGGKVALNCLRPLSWFNATFPPDIKGKTLYR